VYFYFILELSVILVGRRIASIGLYEYIGFSLSVQVCRSDHKGF